ncbi:PREDICTED: probable L-type lectin-domain containing receptor kinase S.5 [Nelumbo nucifera]|uniref:Protein kinase domain-containing protein n=2 Tax=Nelumbo nucifera TaxID=4432 RepID=A0A822ZMJ8_NELNU|nr:PREDICTED: probable L-type lectin-domain containing receptor kinase S.5 [Nelumbo nucifera]DAD46442.1 TPA_asm: hypothetical protein HUJ06_016379 [Nelumbo nucifera]
MTTPEKFISAILLSFLCIPSILGVSSSPAFYTYNKTDFQTEDLAGNLTAKGNASINGGALQITLDSSNTDYRALNNYGRIMLNRPFKLWDETSGSVASFYTSFTVNFFRPDNQTAAEGFAFVIAPNLTIPSDSYGQWLGLTNASTDGNPSNKLVAIELDTVRQGFDPDDNHIGLDINSVNSAVAVSLNKSNIILAPVTIKRYVVWIDYNGTSKVMDVYMAEQGQPKPSSPLINYGINLTDYVAPSSYFGFSASTGNTTYQLNCVLSWNLTVEMLPEEKDQTQKNIAIGVGVGGGVVVVASLVGVVYFIHRRRMANDPRIMGTLKSLPGHPREFRFKEMKKATNNFDEKMKLGQGGFGMVYRGVLPKENLEIAVKKFSRDSVKSKDDFLSELSIINRLRHKHLVRLVGWCHKNGILLLVYEYMPNGSLDKHLFDVDGAEQTLSWEHRSKAISGVASALHYLHTEYDQKVVHRDIKPSNIMLDSNFNARLGDFGLARALDHEKTSYAEMDAQGMPGTMGYLAPECFHTLKATRESDVYAFGTVVLEVVSGQRPWTKIEHYSSLVDWVWALHREGRLLEAVDERLRGEYVVEEALRLLQLGLACSNPEASQRPKAQQISQIISASLPPPHLPPFKPRFVWPPLGPLEDSSTEDSTTDTTPMNSSYCVSLSTPQSLSREDYVRHTRHIGK